MVTDVCSARLLVQVCATIAALCAVVAGYGAKPTRVQRAELALSRGEVGSTQAEAAYKELKAALKKQKMEMNRLTHLQVSVSLRLRAPLHSFLTGSAMFADGEAQDVEVGR